MQITPKKLPRGKYNKFLKTIPPGSCLLCEYKKYQIVLREWSYWVLLEPISPYFSYHVMLCPKRHAQFFRDLKAGEKNEFWKADEKILNSYVETGVKKMRLQAHFRYKKFGRKSRKLYQEHLHLHYYRFRENDFAHLIPKNIHKTKTARELMRHLKK